MKTKKTKGRKPKEYPSVPQVLRWADLPDCRFGGKSWPAFVGGDLVTIEAAARDKFTTVMNKRGLRVMMEGSDPVGQTYNYRIYDPAVFAEMQKRANTYVLNHETVPAAVNGRQLWRLVFDKIELGREYLVTADLVTSFVNAANGRGYSTETGPADEAGMRTVVLRQQAPKSARQVRDQILNDLGTLPGKWLVVIHDSVASKGALERLSEHQRAVLLEGGAA
jgi:hypothetical protein